MADRTGRHFFLWLLQLLLFVALPVTLFHYGFSHIERLRSANLLKLVEQNLDKEMRDFEAYADNERFLAATFKETYFTSTAANASDSFHLLRERLDDCFDYLIWNASDTFVTGSIDPESFEGNWSMAWMSLRKAFAYADKDVKASDEEIVNLRKLLGPQVVLTAADTSISDRGGRLMWCDSTNQRPLVWVASRHGYSVIAFVPQSSLQGTRGLEYYLKYCQNRESYLQPGFVKNKVIIEYAGLPDRPENLPGLTTHGNAPGERIETEAAIYFPRVVEDDLTLFACVRKDAVKPDTTWPSLIAFLVFMLLLPWVIISTRSILNNTPIRMSISRKLALLFAYANGLPLLMLFFTGYDFIHQKELALYDEIHAQGTSYLQNLDERFESEHALQIVNIQKSLQNFKISLRKDGLTFENYARLAEQMYSTINNRHDMRFYLIASEANVFGTGDSIYFGETRRELLPEIIDSPDLKRNDERRILNSIGRFIMATLNGHPPDPRSSTEVELIAESAMQKPLLEVQHDFIANDGRIEVWGMGTNKNPACLNFVSANDNGRFDYMIIANWTQGVLEELYLRRQFLSANRNIVDLQIGLIQEQLGIFLPEKLPDRQRLLREVANFTSKPCPPRQFVTIASQSYLLMGFIGRYLQNYKLFALYPVESVKSQINREKTGLFFAGLVSLLITLILGRFLADSFLFPLQKLHSGAEAIRSRDFAMRLPPLGRDEFGEMAEIFNTTMVDLEELKVAGVIQEHLLPRRLPECGNFKLFGRIVSMGDLGGDYFDYFNTSEGRFSVLIGDVAGSGAGAALIMAMAKAAIMQMQDVLEKPDQLAMSLHNLIKAASNRTQKTMIMQYLNLNGHDGTGCYTNAGGWPPLIVNPGETTAREITLPGPMLGALKRPVYSTVELACKPGDAIIFYSDGVIEATNESGEILGLSRLKEMAAAAWNTDPATYFDSLLAAHRRFTGAAKVRDDMTLVIVIAGETTASGNATVL